jgi:hypothetical protein
MQVPDYSNFGNYNDYCDHRKWVESKKAKLGTKDGKN